MPKKLSDYKDYEGTDVSLEISLYEYGLIWKEEDTKYRIVYGVSSNESGNYDSFCSTTMSEQEFIDITEESWFDKKGWDSYRDTDKITFPIDLHSAIQYYGVENMFGSNYSTFVIEED